MSFDSVFNGDPRTTGVTASGKAQNGIDLASGQVYFKDDAVGGWQPTAGGGGTTGPLFGYFLAAENIGAHDAVMLDVGGNQESVILRCDTQILPSAPFLGVAPVAALAGTQCLVQLSGIAKVNTNQGVNIQPSAYMTCVDSTVNGAVAGQIQQYTPLFGTSSASGRGNYIIGVSVSNALDDNTVDLLIAPFLIPTAGPIIRTYDVDDTIFIDTGSGTAVTTVVLATGGASGISLALGVSSPGSFPAGTTVTVKKVDSGVGAVTVTSTANSIEGASSKVLSAQYDSITVMSDGVANWYIF